MIIYLLKHLTFLRHLAAYEALSLTLLILIFIRTQEVDWWCWLPRFGSCSQLNSFPLVAELGLLLRTPHSHPRVISMKRDPGRGKSQWQWNNMSTHRGRFNLWRQIIIMKDSHNETSFSFLLSPSNGMWAFWENYLKNLLFWWWRNYYSVIL